MKPPHRIREIAAQAGLSQATVDRVLHLRGGVRESTVREVHRAIADLNRGAPPPVAPRPLPVDVVITAGSGLVAEVRAALDAEPPALVKPRLHVAEDPGAVPGVLDRVGRSRSAGVVLWSADVPGLTEALRRLPVPVVPLVTDVVEGLRQAGATAAYLVEQWMADRAGDVLLVGGGDDEQTKAFRGAISPNRRLLDVPDPARARETLAGNRAVRAVYTMAGAGNEEVLGAFAAAGRTFDVFVAHGLGGGNDELLRAGRISAVLHHDVRAELRRAFAALFGTTHGAVGAAVVVLTPYQI